MELKDYLARRQSSRAEARRSEDLHVGITFANNLMKTRRARGMTQAQLAKKARTTQPRIASYEAGDANPTLRVLGRLARALQVEVPWLVQDRSDFESVFPVEDLLTISGHKAMEWVSLATESGPANRAESGRISASVRVSNEWVGAA